MFFEAFPQELNNDLQEVLKIIPNETYNKVSIGCSETMFEYHLDHIIVKIPYRMYFVDSPFEKVHCLSEIQQEILYCIYTRSCNGYVREKYLNKLLECDFPDWSMPFIVKLCGEYVAEILELIYNQLKERNNSDIKSFCLENKSFVAKDYHRMISYWNEYYRDREPDFHKYVGRKLFRECLGYDRTFER